MKTFIDKDFLLQNETARELYHDHAEDMPIFDFHNHLIPGEIAANRSYRSITEVWLGGDHYKWRAMRADGVEEELITGDAPDIEKFRAWAAVVPHTIGNPLFHWTHLELLRYFEIDDLLDPSTADDIYRRANELLNTENFRVASLIKRMNVKVLCTTDDPTDSLEYHRQIAEEGLCSARVLPTFRPDKALATEDPALFNAYVDRLAAAADIEIKDYRGFIEALDSRHAFFHTLGGRASDHALTLPVYVRATEKEISGIFNKLRGNHPISREEAAKFATAGLLEFGRMNAKRGWVMQLHIGALRNNNSRMFRLLGPDTGYDAIADGELARPLASFLDHLDSEKSLPKTVVYNLNPRDNMLLAALIGSFQGGGIPGKLQFGSGWWFNDQKDGMIRQLTDLANTGLLYRFIGMLTDSRSFLSFPRHEYFRRILCNFLGELVEQGEAPKDMKLLGEMVRKISYTNAEEYFGGTSEVP
jgi:glucuronate isomerase